MKKIFALALLAAFALVGCNPTPDPVPQPQACDQHDVDLITTEVSGMYYHNEYSESENVFDYAVVLSNQVGVYDLYTGGVDLKPEQSYLFLDIYSTVSAPNYSASFKLPNGTYTLDVEGTTAAGTVGAEFSELIVINADNEAEEIFFSSGTVTITDHLIDAVLTGEDGKVYHVQGVNKVVDNSTTYGAMQLDGYPTTTLTSDLALNFSANGSFIYADNYEDYFIVGKNLWYITVLDEEALYEIPLMILLDPAKELPAGNFQISGNVCKETALFGYMDPYYGSAVGCWLVQYTPDYELGAMAALKSGNVSLAFAGETATVTINAVDEAGNKITGTCTAPYEVTTGWSLKKLSTAVKFAHAKKELAPRKVKPMAALR